MSTPVREALFIRLPPALLRWLRQRAARNRRKIGQEVEVIFEEARDREVRPPPEERGA